MNTAQVIPFKKPSQPAQGAGKSMYSDKFDQGYVMSSRLYRKEVWPFISDAARNVYAELENRINGHNKESDFVSYSQLQGGYLPGSRKLSSKTVTNGIKELIKLGVISVIASGKQGVKRYQLNEISLIDHFTKESTLPSKERKESALPSDADHFAGQPFNMEVEFLPPDHSQVPNTAMFHKIQAHETVLYVRNSIGGQCNQYDLEHKSFNQSAFQNLTYTGPVSVSMNGWSTLHEMELKITHNKPLPFHVQSVAMLVSMNER